jgi:hypothetical protein
MSNVYIGIGNTDNKLTQQEWAAFVEDVEVVLEGMPLHGAWFSRPDAPWQNACWLMDISQNSSMFISDMKARLVRLATRYNQDSIAWAEAETEFLGAPIE